MKWNAWEDYRGISKEFVQKMFIIYASKLLNDEGLEKWIDNPNRPGPSYYDDCKQWNWVDNLVESHKKHLKKSGLTNIYGVELTDEEIERMNKLNGLDTA